MKKKLLFIEPREFDRTELSRALVQDNYELFFYSTSEQNLDPIICKGIGTIGYNFDPYTTVKQLHALCDQHAIEGIAFSQDYPGGLLGSLLIQQRGLIGPSLTSTLFCQHKYESRLKQKCLVPQATPDFNIINARNFNYKEENTSFPLFIKPVKSSFSIFADRVEDREQLRLFLENFELPAEYINHFNWFLDTNSHLLLTPHHLLIEQLLQGVQVTLEGYIIGDQVAVIGVVDSHFFPDGLSFKSFEYPSQLDLGVQQRMAAIAKKFVLGIGLSNTLFNIEFIYCPQSDAISIVEVHARMSAQFADLYEKVDGVNSYEILLAIASGQKLPEAYPAQNNVAASFVLRTFENGLVEQVPGESEKKLFYDRFPNARFYSDVQVGEKLSDVKQDGRSYRYGLVHLGARDHQELYEKFEEAQRLLPFTFKA